MPYASTRGTSSGDGGIPERFENPGFPPHLHRGADLDEGAAKRAERVVGGLFLMSILGTLGFIVAYFAIGSTRRCSCRASARPTRCTSSLGLTMALSLLGIGLGAVQWAKTLMPDDEEVEMRHPMRSADEHREDFVEILSDGAETSHLTRRPLIKYAMGGALGLFAVPVVLPLIGGLGPMPGDDLSVSFWNGDQEENGRTPTSRCASCVTRRTRRSRRARSPSARSSTSCPRACSTSRTHILEEKAKAAVIVMRLDPDDIKAQKEKDWGHQGIVAYSKICTHVGCPVGLYEQQTHHLLCPCHQSTFDVTQDCKVIFGPAKRPLPQLPITVDDEGYLISKGPFKEATGPSFWERGSA